MARKQAQRVHGEYFQAITRKSCPCGSNSVRGGVKHQVYAWGEYVRAKWRTVDYFCEKCFQTRVIPQLIAHAGGCGCTFELRARSGHSIPSWIRMPQQGSKVCDREVVSALMASPWEKGMLEWMVGGR